MGGKGGKGKRQSGGSYGNNRSNNQHAGTSGHARSNPGTGSYVGAPYNFVPIGTEVLKYEELIPAQNSTEKRLYSGTVGITITAKKPICVGGKVQDGVAEFYKNREGKAAIPGSTIRGLIRNNAQILSHSCFDDDIEDCRFMYREVGSVSGNMKREYDRILGLEADSEQVSGPKEVQCGYIANINGTYCIYGTVNDHNFSLMNKKTNNYYFVSEKYINEHVSEFEYLYPPKSGSREDSDYKERFGNDHFGSLLQYKKGVVFVKKEKKTGKNTEVHYCAKDPDYINDGKYNRDTNCKHLRYVPFREKVSYDLDYNNEVVGISGCGKDCLSYKGVLVGTGYMQEKKALYIIPEMDESKPPVISEINDKDIKAYEIDLKKKETILKSDKNGKVLEFYKLPKPGESRPIFYINAGSRLYFGYTPNLRVFFHNTTKKGLNQDTRSVSMDYSRAIFGYVGEKDSRKTRISCTDAVICPGTEESAYPVSYVLSTPKPTSCLDYIEQNPVRKSYVASYNDDDFIIRGVKQYWNKIDVVAPGHEKEKVGSKFKTMPKGSSFNGYVYYHNLTGEELGLLLWSIVLDGDSYQNLGKGKPYGYGEVYIKVNKLMRFDPEKAYDRDCSFFFEPFNDITDQTEELINLFKQRESVIRDGRSVKQRDIFLKMKNKKNEMPSEKTRYMRIGGKEITREYQLRKKDGLALPSAEEVLIKKESKR